MKGEGEEAVRASAPSQSPHSILFPPSNYLNEVVLKMFMVTHQSRGDNWVCFPIGHSVLLPPDRKMTQILRNFLVGTHLIIVGTNLLIFPMIKNNIHFLKTQIL